VRDPDSRWANDEQKQALRTEGIERAKERLQEGAQGIPDPLDQDFLESIPREHAEYFAEHGRWPQGANYEYEMSHLSAEPEYADDPSTIVPRTATDHRLGDHGGNTQDDPMGSPLDPEWMTRGEYEKQSGVRVQSDDQPPRSNTRDAADVWLAQAGEPQVANIADEHEPLEEDEDYTDDSDDEFLDPDDDGS
jgi:hypothetical protein